jgi:uncharacterized protein (UPF0548 family)
MTMPLARSHFASEAAMYWSIMICAPLAKSPNCASQSTRVRVGTGIAVFEAEHAVFGQRAVVDFEVAVRQRRQRHVLVLVVLVDPDRVTLAEVPRPQS